MSFLHFLILLPFLACIFIPFIYKKLNIHLGWIVVFVPLFIFINYLLFIPSISKGNYHAFSMPWIPSLGINFDIYMDGLALLFGLIISGVGTLVVVYSIFYMDKNREALHNFYIYLLLFMGAMLGLVSSDHVLVLYTLWELTSVSSFLLIAYWYERKKSRAGALKAMIITVFGGLAMLAGLIILSIIADTYSIREMIANVGIIKESSLFIPALILILIGAFTKSAQFPFSIWLPDAMEAPTPVSAYLHSATMVKAGIYLVARMTPIFGGSATWFWLVSGIGLVTLMYGSFRAVRQTDLKALLAFSTISQLGLIMSLLGVGSAALYYTNGEAQTFYAFALFAALFHLFNHATFKGALFMVVGIIDHETGTRDIRRLGGLMAIMPATFTIALIGSLAMAGLPPFNGFLSKEMFFTGMLRATEVNMFSLEWLTSIFPVVAWVASVFTFIYCFILLVKPFLGELNQSRLPKEKVHEAPIGMLIPPIILGLLVVFVFFFPNLIGKYLLNPALYATLSAEVPAFEIIAWHGFGTELWMTIGVIVFGLLLFFSIKRWTIIFRVFPDQLSINSLYMSGLENMEKKSVSLTDRYMTGNIRHYLLYIFIVTFSVLIIALVGFDGISFDFSTNSYITIYDIGIVIAMVAAAFTTLLTTNRITAIVSLGAVGYIMVMLFVIFRAPDLALTQMVVETATTALFLLCFYHLPKLGKRIEKMKFKLTNLIVSILVGVTVTIMTLVATGHRLFTPINEFFENAYELAGAKNIVNAILVDFRGFDTMLEIAVLFIAGIGVYTLIKLRPKGDDSQ
ncbi:Na+/H+ antiporter subunit A [Ornithinibacillus halotolerans]|uniref:Na+/H+ antiporter subunit A n=1 Tax=Ornithinibacillus halotolerans TaxID=1274357 RepID=A0A916RWL6_9BACI|nr:Na+/H+ antiporter subunit A [Ornithinibacillus halotolerans]GGA72764.1 Na+/H+ antiporter subunit A [Ornithinibacillus halotolerans]